MVTKRRNPTLTDAVDAALGKVQVQPEDGAAVALARKYAEQIDAAPDDLAKVGTQLLQVLTALGMTPAGRAAVVGKGGGRGDGVGRSKLGRFREQHGGAGQHAAAPVD